MSELLTMPVQAPSKVRRAKPWEGGRHAWTWGYCANDACRTPGLQAMRMRRCAFCREELTIALLCACGESIHPLEAERHLATTGSPKECQLCQRELTATYLGHLMAANLKALLAVISEQATVTPIGLV